MSGCPCGWAHYEPVSLLPLCQHWGGYWECVADDNWLNPAFHFIYSPAWKMVSDMSYIWYKDLTLYLLLSLQLHASSQPPWPEFSNLSPHRLLASKPFTIAHGAIYTLLVSQFSCYKRGWPDIPGALPIGRISGLSLSGAVQQQESICSLHPHTEPIHSWIKCEIPSFISWSWTFSAGGHRYELRKSWPGNGGWHGGLGHPLMQLTLPSGLPVPHFVCSFCLYNELFWTCMAPWCLRVPFIISPGT